MDPRAYTSKRYSILKAYAEALKVIDGTGEYRSNLYDNIHPRMAFWDEIEHYPAVHMALGPEQRVYQGGGYKDRYLTITVRLYVNNEDSQMALESLLEDIETVTELNGRLAYQDSSGVTQYTRDILIQSIETDEGALAPIAAGEISLLVQY